VAEWDHQLVGCCGIYPTEGLPPETAELVKFYLSPAARGRGIGKQLIEKSIQSARELGYKKIYLESMPQFSKAVDLYNKLGFTVLKKSLGNSGHTSCSIWMLLRLVDV
jgi:putative acetyltransferase